MRDHFPGTRCSSAGLWSTLAATPAKIPRIYHSRWLPLCAYATSRVLPVRPTSRVRGTTQPRAYCSNTYFLLSLYRETAAWHTRSDLAHVHDDIGGDGVRLCNHRSVEREGARPERSVRGNDDLHRSRARALHWGHRVSVPGTPAPGAPRGQPHATAQRRRCR